MKRFRSLVAASMATVLLVASLALTGCLGSTGSKEITLKPTIDTPTIIESGVLKVGVDTTRAPFAGQSKGKIIGIDVDLAAAVAEQLGLKLELVDIAGESADDMLAAGTVDVVMDIEKGGVQSTQAVQVGPYLIDGPALFMVQLSDSIPDIDLTALASATVAAQENSLSAWQVAQVAPDSTIISVPALEEAFNQLSDGKVTYVAADAVVGAFLATKEVDYENISCVKMLGDPLGVYMGVAQGNTALANALTEALRAVRDGGVLNVVITKWLGPVSAQVVSSEQAIVTIGANGAAGSGSANGSNSTGSSANSGQVSGTTEATSGEVDTGDDLPDPSLAGGS
ncbi:MAG: amino acid ABC transporter substrate-binding protein [Coriobacteriaceae bacterium]|nr:amino acid ABC transporter substrate-binding protein [Coriobacteriaceae bacterium]